MSEWFNIKKENELKVSNTLKNLLNIQYKSEKIYCKVGLMYLLLKMGLIKPSMSFRVSFLDQFFGKYI